MVKKETMVKKTSFSLKKSARPEKPSRPKTVPPKGAVTGEDGWSDEWIRFINVAEELKRNATSEDRGVQIWLDSGLKKKLDMLHASGLRYPVRQLLNAAVTVFLENCAEDVKKQLKNL
jgi:hypothetical protein